jgi:sugar phosphate permease
VSGVGAILGGLLLSHSGNAAWLAVMARRSAMGLGLLVVALGLAPGFWSGTAAVFVLGVCGVISGVGLQVLLQKAISATYRGRVLGLWGMCNVAGPGVGGAIIGAATQVLGLRGATVVGGLISSALAVWIVRQARQAPQK